MTQRELSLAGLILSEGRALVVVANKLDALPDDDQTTYLSVLRSTIEERFLDAGQLPVVGMSALTCQGVEELMPVVYDSYRKWNRRSVKFRIQIRCRMSSDQPCLTAVGLILVS